MATKKFNQVWLQALALEGQRLLLLGYSEETVEITISYFANYIVIIKEPETIEQAQAMIRIANRIPRGIL